MSTSRYPQNWKEIATSIKESFDWRCTRCNRVCLRPGQKPPELTLSQRRVYTLQVHHFNFDPSDNRLENLAPLCSGCHLYYHRFRRGNISPGQLSLFKWVMHKHYRTLMNAPWQYMKRDGVPARQECDGVLALFGGDRKSPLWGLCPTYTVNIMEIRILKLILNISCIFNNKLLLAVVS